MSSASMQTLKTERLVMRPWRALDAAPFAALNADPEVMRHFPAPLSRDESDALLDSWRAAMAKQGWGVWALCTSDENTFIGAVGLQSQPDRFEFSPCVEVLWRLSRDYWGQGFASEAARASLLFAFEVLDQAEVVSFTTVQNRRSEAVMQRIGMRACEQTFLHPQLSADDPLAEHVLYTLDQQEWRTFCKQG